MIRWLIFSSFLLIGYRSAAQDAALLLSRGAQLEAAFREEEALPVYENAAQLQPRNIVALIHCSDLLCRVGHRLKDRNQMIAYFRRAYGYAQRAYRIDSTNSDANVVMAFSLARLALDQNGKERVVSANEIRRYAEQAIRNDPGNFKAYHILGRWHYEVSNLNFLERTLARWFFGALPESSLSECISNLEKSKALRPDFMLNYFELARAYHREGRNDRAVALLTQMETLPDEMYDDRTVRAQGQKLLKELR
jgi:tetratricopeptide (TPR) repeat protein